MLDRVEIIACVKTRHNSVGEIKKQLSHAKRHLQRLWYRYLVPLIIQSYTTTMVVTRRTSVGATTSFSVGLHTDQQSLILGEMMTARNKLQQENQMLRDRLQDSEMMVRLLQYKLSENKIEFDLTKEFGIAVDDFPVLTHKANRKPMEKVKSNLNKNAFRNQVAPGKKTFESKAIKISTAAGLLTKFNITALPPSPKSRAVLHTMSCSPDSRFAEPEETRPNITTNGSKPQSQQPQSKTRRSSVISSINKKLGKSDKSISKNNHVHCFGEEQFPGDANQMRSVIGKLAQVVINEYSTTDDDDENIIFE